jgi:hypothetical protein
MGKRPVVLAALAAVWTTGALADEATPAAPAPACDFFAAELIGEFCGHTAYVAPFGGGSDETINQTRTVPPRPLPFRRGGGTIFKHWDYQNTYEGVTLAVSPWEGVRFHVSGEAFQFDDSYSTHNTLSGFHRNVVTPPDSGGVPGWFDIGVEATIWDTHFGTPFGNVHYVFNAVGGMQLFPGGGPYRDRDEQHIGWQSGAELPLGGSGFSLDYLATNLLRRFDNPGIVDFDDMTRVLLANNAWGVAIGPRIEGATVLWHSPRYNTGWSAFGLGGEALVEPFRHTSIPVLRDLTLDLSAVHSLGQADLVPDWAGSASGYIYAAEARFNFAF